MASVVNPVPKLVQFTPLSIDRCHCTVPVCPVKETLLASPSQIEVFKALEVPPTAFGFMVIGSAVVVSLQELRVKIAL